MRLRVCSLSALFVCLFLTARTASPQAPQEEIRALNTQILRLHAEAEKAAPAAAAAWRAQAAPVVARRAQLLEALIRQNPAEALRQGFPPDVLARLAAAFPQAASLLEARGVWRGPVEHLVIDDAGLSRHESLVHITINLSLIHISEPTRPY